MNSDIRAVIDHDGKLLEHCHRVYYGWMRIMLLVHVCYFSFVHRRVGNDRGYYSR